MPEKYFREPSFLVRGRKFVDRKEEIGLGLFVGKRGFGELDSAVAKKSSQQKIQSKVRYFVVVLLVLVLLLLVVVVIVVIVVVVVKLERGE
jgi:heme/copper-type cytochrome/quinol oxidase subunit 2